MNKFANDNELQQLSNLAASYDQLALTMGNTNSKEGFSGGGGNNVKLNVDPLFEGDGGIQTHTLRLDFSRFDGAEPTEWILKAQQLFAYCSTPDDHRLQIASFHMEGKSLSWYWWLMDSSPVHTWKEFVSVLKIHFGLSAYEDLVGAFTKLYQVSSVEECQT